MPRADVTLAGWRARAVTRSLFQPTTLAAAIRRLGFVQADPIRAPARAQDLILRHRVTGYRAGDLERRYPQLELEEDILYAYGFLPRPIAQLLLPRRTPPLSRLEQRVLDAVERVGAVHPRDLEAEFGRDRVVNAWGGVSQATKHTLERLHYRGLLRIARRDTGIRVYEPALPLLDPQSGRERYRRLLVAVAHVLAPVPERTLRAIAAPLRRSAPEIRDHRAVLRDLIASGELAPQVIDGVVYLWPGAGAARAEAPPAVRFLAPFDPLVWDRRRFAHFWGWEYRFEAYTPPAKRVRGYYAMPLLWEDQVIGWVNAVVVGGRLDIDLGFVAKRPVERAFSRELDAEIARLEAFLEGA
jgi:uncharacterized protein YcaQ